MPDDRPVRPTGLVRSSERGTRIVIALIGMALTALAGFLALKQVGWGLVSLSYDLPFLVHRAPGNDELRIVFLDELDGEFLDRTSQAALLDELTKAGARAVLYDVIFDRASGDPAVDAGFAAAMNRFRRAGPDGYPSTDPDAGWIILACGRKTYQVEGAAVEQLIAPNDTLLGATDDFGLVAYDEDLFLARKVSTGTRDEPSLSWKAAARLGGGLDETRRNEPRWLNFTGPPPQLFRSCSASSVLAGEVDSAFFAGKIVLIGGEPGIVGEALGKDLFATPFHRLGTEKYPLLSGVELQAQNLANLLDGKWLVRSSRDFDKWLVVAAAVLCGLLFTLLKPARAFLAALALVVALVVAGVLAVHLGGVWFPWTAVAFLQVPVALVWGSGSHFYVERFFRLKLSEEQKALREAFAKDVSPQMLDRLTKENFNMKLGGELVDAVMMFTDIEDFTNLCERVNDPEIIVHNLNDYFERTTEHIFEHDAVVIKFIGDAIFAAWGAPVPDPDAARKSVRAAWNVFLHSKFVVRGEELRTRIGLHYGEVVSGNIGSARHVDYTVIGDATNTAARLEGLNKMLETSILLSEAVHRQLDDEFITRRVGTFLFKGKETGTTVYELVGPASEGRPGWIDRYESALEALRDGDHEKARQLLESVGPLRSHGTDGPSTLFLETLRDRPELLDEDIMILKEK